MKCNLFRRRIPRLKDSATKMALAAGVALVGAGVLQSCSDDLLTGQPDWLGNSIYERLQEEGNYSTTLKLIDDLNYTGVLSQTGSKTLFVANDDAYADWFRTNSWGVRKYEDLSTAQKKLLLNNEMVNNAYLIELLSNISATGSATEPLKGRCMRRASAVTIYDSVPRLLPKDMPSTSYWERHRAKSNGIVLVKDATTPPMIHFLPAFMEQNKITDSDLQKLTNGESQSISDSWVNGKKVTETDITCKNGYIHKVEDVISAADNMAEIIHNHPSTTQWATLIDRYAAPFYDDDVTKNYNRLYNNSDSVFVLRYFAEWGADGKAQTTDPDGNNIGDYLTFDPGWNQYYVNSNTTMQEDCAAMLVPTNAALNEWWNDGGKPLQDEYGSWENVPNSVLKKLINVNMISSFIEHVPSKFSQILNDAKVSMGVEPSDVDSCFMGCNGVVYMTNKVFGPAAYKSVSFPALIHEKTMNVIYKAIEALEFDAYLNSMDSYYSFILPTNGAMLTYLDPASYGETVGKLWEFYYDETQQKLAARVFDYNIDSKTKVSSDSTVLFANTSQGKNSDPVLNRLNDLLDNIIVIGDIEDGHEFYQTKGGGTIRVTGSGSNIQIYGSWQNDTNEPIAVTTIYNEDNGKAYVVESEVPMTTKKSVYQTLAEHQEFSLFYDLIRSGDPDDASSALMISQKDKKYTCVDYNVRLFDGFNYTVWVPTNSAIEQLHSEGRLPYWTDFEAQTAEAWGGDKTKADSMKSVLKDRINNFVRYHIMDNAVYVDANNSGVTASYETAKMNTASAKFYNLSVVGGDGTLSVTDYAGNTRKVLTSNKGLYNDMVREYWFSGTGTSSIIYQSSTAVIHQIDGALFYDADQLPVMDWEPKSE